MTARSVQRVNISAPEFRYFPDFPEGFRPGMARLGMRMGAEGTGMSVYELPAGKRSARTTTKTRRRNGCWCSPAGRRCAIPTAPTSSTPGMSSSSRRAPTAPTRFVTTDSTARVLMFSNTSKVAASVCPDSDKIAIWTGNDDDDLIVKRTSGVDYWDGEG